MALMAASARSMLGKTATGRILGVAPLRRAVSLTASGGDETAGQTQVRSPVDGTGVEVHEKRSQTSQIVLSR